MPFNKDLIDSGCALKTFDGDLSALERVIDWTLTKPNLVKLDLPEQKCVASVVVTGNKKVSPAPSVDVSTRPRRHIKEVVYGENLDDLPSLQEICIRNDPVPKQVGEVCEVSAQSGFCFRHIAEDVESVSQTFQLKTRDEAPLQSARPVATSKVTRLPLQATESTRAARSVKDVVYGETDFDRECGKTGQSHTKCETPSTPQPAIKHFKSCVHEMCDSTASAPHTSAVKQMPAEVSHRTHWRSTIHGF